MKSSSARQKGGRFENYLVEDLKKSVDAKTSRNYASGAGLDKNDIRMPGFDIEIEAKNAMTIHLIKDWEQLESQTTSNTGVLMIRNPKKPEFNQTLVVMDYEDWKELIKKQKDSVTVENNIDSNLKWKIKRLKDYANEVFKDL